MIRAIRQWLRWQRTVSTPRLIGGTERWWMIPAAASMIRASQDLQAVPSVRP